MKFKDKYDINKEFTNLFTFDSEDDEIRHDAHILMFRFFNSLINNNISSKKIRQKDLAVALNRSPSFISQVMQGEKLMNLISIAKLQKKFGVQFQIIAKPVIDYEANEKEIINLRPVYKKHKYWSVYSETPDYTQPEHEPVKEIHLKDKQPLAC